MNHVLNFLYSRVMDFLHRVTKKEQGPVNNIKKASSYPTQHNTFAVQLLRLNNNFINLLK